MNSGKKWTKEEVKYLSDNYESLGAKGCVTKLKREPTAIQRKANKLGLSYGGVKPHYQKSNLEYWASKSNSFSDLLRNLGLRVAGGNHKKVKDYISQYGIDTSHFEQDYSLRDKALRSYLDGIKVPLDTILVEGSSYNRSHLKRRLLEENLLEYKCRKCENTGEWLGEPITLQLEHINGVHDDNRLENIEFLCPNCHSQTKTFAGRNKNNSVL